MRKQIIQFLYEHESNNISASAAILEAFDTDNDRFVTPILYGDEIVAVYYYKPGTKFMPLVSPAGRLYLKNNPPDISFYVFSAMGQSRDLELFKHCFPAPSHTQEYVFMKRPCKDVSMHHPSGFKDGKVYQINESNYSEVMNLQLAYEVEEVLIPGHFQNPKSTEALLKKTVKKQLVLGFSYKNTSIAKAGTNARGLRWDSIGGVFTAPEYRKKGISTYLMAHLLKQLYRSKRSTALFVKNENGGAIKVYKKLGYSPLNSYAIHYYE